MAISSTAVWEVRTTGTATAGGFYNASGSSPGTDYSQQDAPQVAVADAVANGTTTVTSATANFAAAHNRNGVYIGGAWYEIAAVTNATTIVVDRTIATASGLALNVGGAMDHPATAGGAYGIGHTIHVKSGTYLHGTTANVSGGRLNVSVALAVYGYTATRGDDAPTRPIMQANGSSMTIWAIANSGTYYCRVRGIDFYRDAAGALTLVTGLSIGQAALVEKCRVRNANPDGSSGGGFITSSSIGSTFQQCQADGCSTGFRLLASGTTLEECASTNSSTYGFYLGGTTAPATAIRCVASGSGSYGFYLNNGSVVDSCVARGGSSFGFLGNTQTRARRCLSVGNANQGFVGSMQIRDCAGYNNPTGNYDNSPATIANGVENFITLTADPFTNAAGLDFSLNSTTGGGAACKAISSTFPGLAGTSYPDVGAYQSAAGSSGASGVSVSRIFGGL